MAEHVHAPGQQYLEHVVQALRVGTLQIHQRFQFGQLRQLPGRELVLARDRPVTVALDGVDFAVVGEKAKWLRQSPLGEGVGREALMEYADRRLQFRALQIGIQHRQVFRHHQPLVREYVGREAGDVEDRIVVHGDLGAAARHEQGAFEGVRLHLRRGVDKHLQDVGLGLQRLGTTGLFRVQRYLAPAGQRQRAACDRGLDGRAGRLDMVWIDEHEAGGKSLGRIDPGLVGEGAQEGLGCLHQQPTAVAGFAIGGDRTAVGHALQGLDGRIQDPVTRYPFHVRDQAKAAVVALEFRAVQGAVQLVLSHRSTPVAGSAQAWLRGSSPSLAQGREKGAEL